MSRWKQTRKQPTAAKKRAIQHTKALAECKQREHSLTPTFRPGERVCRVCSIVLYCSVCLQESNLAPLASTRAYPFACSLHRHVEVQV